MPSTLARCCTVVPGRASANATAGGPPTPAVPCAKPAARPVPIMATRPPPMRHPRHIIKTIKRTKTEIAIFIMAGSSDTRTRVPNGAATKVVIPNGKTNGFSDARIVSGRSWITSTTPDRLEIATAARGPRIKLSVMIKIMAAPNPTNPRIKPAIRTATAQRANVVPGIEASVVSISSISVDIPSAPLLLARASKVERNVYWDSAAQNRAAAGLSGHATTPPSETRARP